MLPPIGIRFRPMMSTFLSAVPTSKSPTRRRARNAEVRGGGHAASALNEFRSR